MPISRSLLANPLLWVLIGLLMGLSLWLVPAAVTLIAVPLMLGGLYLITKPKWCFLATIFTLPWQGLIIFYAHIYDLFMVFFLFSLVIQWFKRELIPVSLRTRLDWWIIPLFVWMMIKGATSADSAAGALYGVRHLLGFIGFYTIIYMLRSKSISIKTLLLTVVYSVLFQIALGNFQSLTGMGYIANANWAVNDRNYFYFLGLGSKTAQQAFGTFPHFATFGHFMTTCALFFAPFLFYVVPNQKKWLWAFISLFWTVVITYSRGALSSFIVVTGYFCFLFPRLNTKLIKYLQLFFIISMFLTVYIMVFKNYGKTLSPRDEMWAVSAYYFDQHPEHFWFGSGLRALEATVLNYIPRYIASGARYQFAPHNLYIHYIHQLGIFGTIYFVAGFIFILLNSYKESLFRLISGFSLADRYAPINKPYKRILENCQQWSQAKWAWWSVNAGVHLAIVVVLFGGTNDHIYGDPYLFSWLLLLFALMYSLPWTKYKNYWEESFPVNEHLIK